MMTIKAQLYRYSAIFTIAVSVFVLISWIFDLPQLQFLSSGLGVMKFNAAVCFCLLGFSLLLHAKARYKVITSVLLLAVFLMSIATATEYFFLIDLGIDHYFVKEFIINFDNVPLGRMSLQLTMLIFILSILLFFIRFKKVNQHIEFALSFLIVISIAIFLDFIFNANETGYLPTFSQISLSTVIVFIVLCLGTFSSPLIFYDKFSFLKKLNLGVGILLVCFLLLYYIFSKTNKGVLESKDVIQNTEEMIVASATLLAVINESEVNTFQYVISEDPSNLIEKDAPVFVMNRIKKTTDGNQEAHRSIMELEKLVVQHAQFRENVISTRQRKGFESARNLLISEQGKLIKSRIKVLVHTIQENEYHSLDERRLLNINRAKHSGELILFFEILIVISVIISYFVIRRNFKLKRKAQKLLEKSNERFFKIFNFNPIAMAITTVEEGRFIFVNDFYCQETGHKRENLIGKASDDVNIITTAEKLKVRDSIKTHGGEDKDVEIKINRADGVVMTVLFSVQTIFIDKQDCFIYAFVDITDRNKTREKLEEVNKELDSFTYSVSHDLRAPLRAIAGYTKILHEDYGDKIDEDGRHFMDVISKNAIKMGQLIDDLLAFSRLGRQNIVLVPVDMVKMIDSLIEDAKLFSNGKETQIIYNDLLDLKGDGSMLKVVMTNLLSNAVKYSSKKEAITIEIGSYAEENNIIYFVKDNGVGFDMAYSDKLFGVFQRLHSMAEFEGTGVGLAIVHRIITKHGGKIWAESKPDEGATFYFSLPK
ncbi:ATP-binding protein [Flavobacterium algicola]|uniref:ATP-binding protein n=1 Tax=Flavobacterium algicola TaxID=556529 RepID=UPI001EFD9C19|nr:ATP-binding protein [Flavobacterium algicola]MCG9792104.1 ATP-binding protein [Flavobacterium algicola]